MLFPVSEAQPAEIVFAFSAGHVHAALVFLNVGVALRAWLAVGLDPGEIFRIRFFFFAPQLNLLAGSGLVLLFPAFEAKAVTTFALNNIFFSKVVLLDDELAVLGRTPLYRPVVVCELFAVPLQVLRFEIKFRNFTFIICDVLQTLRKMFQKERVRHHDIASLLNTFGKDASCSLRPDLFLQIFRPTHGTELMPAREPNGFQLLVLWIEFIAPNDVAIVVVFL